MGQPQPCQPGDKILGAALAPAEHITLLAAMHRDIPTLAACPGAGRGVHPRQELWPGAYGAVRVQSRGGRAGLWAQPCSHSTPHPQICSLMRGGIAERGGIRVGHRIIEINGQSVVATPHEKIIQILTEAVSEVSWAPPELLGSELCTSPGWRL